jgi:hypothetical protein
MVLSMLLLFILAGLSLSQDISSSQNHTSSFKKNSTAPVSSNNKENATSPTNVTNINNTTATNLKYIWSISGIEKDLINMALNQEGDDLFGQAKYEPENGESWNGEVAGQVSGNQVNLVIIALKGNKQISTVLNGIFSDEAIRGKFFQASNGKILGRGEFNALWINPDLSSYVPAKINELEIEMPATAINSPMASDTSQTYQQVVQQKSRYHDVVQDADRILTGVGDLSQIPIGMSGFV